MFKCYHYVVCVKLNKTRKILRIFFKNEATKNKIKHDQKIVFSEMLTDTKRQQLIYRL